MAEGHRSSTDRRPGTPADAPAVARIYIESWNDGFGHLLGERELDEAPVDRWRGLLTEEKDRPITVACRSGEVVGFVGVGPSRDPIDPALGELEVIAVDPSVWRSGVGRTLMDHALTQLRSGWSSAILWTPARYDRGHGFYRATGWQRLDRTRDDGRQVAFGRSWSDGASTGT